MRRCEFLLVEWREAVVLGGPDAKGTWIFPRNPHARVVLILVALLFAAGFGAN